MIRNRIGRLELELDIRLSRWFPGSISSGYQGSTAAQKLDCRLAARFCQNALSIKLDFPGKYLPGETSMNDLQVLDPRIRRRGSISFVIVIGLAIMIACIYLAANADTENLSMIELVESHGGCAIRDAYEKHDATILNSIWESAPITGCFRPVTTVDLEFCNIDDSVVEEVCRLGGPGLETLNLNNNLNVTDACIPFIHKLIRLDRVSLIGTSITEEGAKRLQLHKGYFPNSGGGGDRIVDHIPSRIGVLSDDRRTLRERSGPGT